MPRSDDDRDTNVEEGKPDQPAVAAGDAPHARPRAAPDSGLQGAHRKPHGGWRLPSRPTVKLAAEIFLALLTLITVVVKAGWW
jgi:hypothetical protein